MEGFSKKIAELREFRKKILSEEKDIKKQIEYEKELIDKKYEEKLEETAFQINKKSYEIEELKTKIVSYSTFEISLIAEIMKDIIKIYEGENFYLEEVNYCPNPKRRILIAEAILLVSEKRIDYIVNNMDKARLFSMIKNGDAIIFDWAMSNDNSENVSFYKINESYDLQLSVKLNKFPYLKEFIDFVISYSIEKDLTEELTMLDLESLRNIFISNNIENIKAYHKEIEAKEELECKKEISERSAYRAKQLTKALKKIDNGGNL